MTKMPAFELPDQDGNIHNSNEFLGKKTVIKEEIDFIGMTVEEFSKATGIEIDIVKDIIDGRQAVSSEFAGRC